MGKYIFVYSVDTVSRSGEFVSVGMILDRWDLVYTIRQAEKTGESILAVTVAMYDDSGAICSERDVTGLFGLKNA